MQHAQPCDHGRKQIVGSLEQHSGFSADRPGTLPHKVRFDRAEDIGAGNKRVIERRLNGSLFVNVAEF